MNDEAQDPYGMAVVLAFRELVTLQEQDSPFILPSDTGTAPDGIRQQDKNKKTKEQDNGQVE